MKIRLSFLLLLVAPLTMVAQQDPLYAQYMNNPLAINPAYAGTHKMLYSTLQYRTQWAGLSGNPVTINFSSHMPVVAEKMGLGLQVIQDQIGENKNTEFNASYSYRIDIKESQLSFGLQAGFINFTNNPDELNILDPDDPSFYPYSEIKFNTGAGLLLTNNDRYIIGLSVPRLLPATISMGGQDVTVYSQNYYVFGSYLFLLSDKLRFKPSALIKATKASAPSVDVNANFTLLDNYSAGVFTRNFKTYGLLLSMRFSTYQLGYALELPGSKSESLNFTTHEIMLGIRLKVFRFHNPLSVQNF